MAVACAPMGQPVTPPSPIMMPVGNSGRRFAVDIIDKVFKKKDDTSGNVDDCQCEAENKRHDALDEMSSALLKSIAGSGRNPVISPSCLYQALAVVSDVTAGDTRSQIAGVIGDKRQAEEILAGLADIEAPSYGCKDFSYSTASSIWLDNKVRVNPEVDQCTGAIPVEIREIAMGSDAAGHEMSAWLSESTGGVYSEAPQTSTEDLAVIMGAMHLKDSWVDEFEDDGKRSFRREDGTSVDADFMLAWEDLSYLESEGSMTLSKRLSSECHLCVSMPGDSEPLRDYISSGRAWDNISSFASGVKTKWRECKLFIPKFTLSSEGLDITSIIRNMGITRIFDPNADFSLLTSDEIMVDSVLQSTRLKVDEEGLEGASYVAILMCGGLPDENPLSRKRSFSIVPLWWQFFRLRTIRYSSAL